MMNGSRSMREKEPKKLTRRRKGAKRGGKSNYQIPNDKFQIDKVDAHERAHRNNHAKPQRRKGGVERAIFKFQTTNSKLTRSMRKKEPTKQSRKNVKDKRTQYLLP